LKAQEQDDETPSDMASADWSAVAAPASDLPAALTGTERPEAILQALKGLEEAMASHAEWLKDWHVSLLSRLDHAAKGQEMTRTSDFTAWYDGPHHRVLSDNPVFDRVGDRLRHMINESEAVADTARTTGTVPTEDYGAFMETVLAFNNDVRRLENDTWNRLANIDPLTGIGNRQAMFANLNVEHDRHSRSEQPCCVAMFDLDFFKAINDTHGHVAGDTVLRSVASLLAASIRPYDRVYRYGGEEFLMCLPNTDPRAAWAIVERLRLKVSNWSVPIKGGIQLQVSVSVGVAPMTAVDSVETALDRADAALYTAKRNGRNCVHIWSAQTT